MQYSPTQAFTARFAVSMKLYNPRNKTVHRALQWLFLRLRPLNRPRYQTNTSGYNTTCDTLEGIHAPGRPQPIPDTTATPGRCTGQHSPPIIIRYIRWQTMPARRGQLLPCMDRWQVLTHCQQYRPGAPAEGSASTPAQGQPGGVLMLSTPGGWRSGTGSAVRPGTLVPFTRRGSPAAGSRRAARNHWRLPPYLFSGFRPIANRGQQ